MKGKLFLLGLVGLLAVSVSTGTAREGYIQVLLVPGGGGGASVYLGQADGATEGFDNEWDSDFNFRPPSPFSTWVEMYSSTSYNPFKLNIDSKPAGSLTPWSLIVSGHGFASPASAPLTINYDNYDSAFDGLTFDLTITDLDNGQLIGTFDLVTYSASDSKITLSDIHSGPSYQIVVTPIPEPSSVVLLVAGLVLSAGVVTIARREEVPKSEFKNGLL